MSTKSLEQFHRIDETIESISKSYSQFIALQIWEDEHYKSITYHELSAAMNRGAQRLQQAGIQPGDRVILLGEGRRIEWVVAFFAIIKAQATAAILDASLDAKDFDTLIDYCDARAILTTEDFFTSLPEETAIPILNYQQSLQPFPDATAFISDKTPKTLDGDPSFAGILFTSGTTFKPKGVLLTHQNMLHVAIQCILFSQAKEGEQVLGVLPLHHSFGLGVMLMTLLSGGTLTFVDKLQGDVILKTMQRSHTSLLTATPRLLEAFHKNIIQTVQSKGLLVRGLFKLLIYLCQGLKTLGLGNHGLTLFKSIHKKFGGHLTRIVSGASPLPVKVLNELEQLGWIVLEGYGLTETGGAISCNQISQRRAGTVGLPIEKSHVKISYPTVHGEGEICFKGPNVMAGYFRDAKSTFHAIREGWLHTGDLGLIDKNGMLTVTGRIKEIIVAASGKKIMPDDVEHRYYNIPGIQELAVVPIRAANRLYDEIHAGIVLDPKIFDSSNSSDSIQQKIKNALSQRASSIPSHLRIQHFHLIKEIPKTTTFKVKRSDLKKLLKAQIKSDTVLPASSLKQIEPPHDAITEKILATIAQNIESIDRQKKWISPHHSLQFDLGIDSLDRIQIAAQLKQEFNIDFENQLFFSIDKVADVISLVKTAALTTDNPPSTRTSSTPFIPQLRPLANKLFFGLFNYASRIVWRIEVEGIEQVPTHTSSILCSNHVTNLDLLFVASCLNEKTRINLCCFAKQDIFDHWFFRKLAQICHAIPINRFGDIQPALQTGMKALQEGRHLLVNPEGTRSLDGKLGHFRKGAAFISLQTGAPLVPIKLIGGFEIFPPQLKLPRFFDWKHFRRYKIKIVFGDPLKLTDQVTEESLTQQLRECIDTLS